LKFLEFGSEFALELVENRDQLDNSADYRKDAFAARYTHLFLNQISSLVDESDFYLQGVFCYACEQHIVLTPTRRSFILQQTKEAITQ
jgi:hypothetical protein